MWKKTSHITVQAEHEGVNIIETTDLKRDIDETVVSVYRHTHTQKKF